MRITFFTEAYFCSGVDTFVINLINHWPNKADHLTLICNHNHSGLNFIESSLIRPCNIVTHKVRIFTGFFERNYRKAKLGLAMEFILKLFSPFLRYVFFVYNICTLKKILLENQADRLLIINQGYPAGDSCRAAAIAWGLFSKKPHSIHNFHGIALKPGWHIKLQEYFVDTLIARFTKGFVSVSQAAAESMSCRKAIYTRHKISHIYNGVDFSKKQEETDSINLKMEIGMPIASPLCLMLGAYHSHKNFDKGHSFLFRAFKKVTEQVPLAHLLICGYGSQENIARVRRLSLDFNIEKNIHLSGFRKDVSFLLRHTDVLLITSQAFETFCLTSIEAMSHGVPVVATNVGGIAEIVVNGQGGYCVDKNDIDSYAGYIIELLKNEVLRKQQGELGFQRYKNFFTACRMAEEYARLIHHG